MTLDYAKLIVPISLTQAHQWLVYGRPIPQATPMRQRRVYAKGVLGKVFPIFERWHKRKLPFPSAFEYSCVRMWCLELQQSPNDHEGKSPRKKENRLKMAEQKDSRHLQARQCPCATLTNPRTFYKESLRFIHCSAKMQLSILLLAAESILAIHTGPLKKKKKARVRQVQTPKRFLLRQSQNAERKTTYLLSHHLDPCSKIYLHQREQEA